MTIAFPRNSALPVFRKPALAALMLSATMLAGCATNKTPQFSYDANVPALPTVNGGVKPGHWAVQNPASTAGTQASAGRA